MGRAFTPDDLREVRKVAVAVRRRWAGALDLDDLVQEGACDVWRCLDQFDPALAPRQAWVGWVARRGMVDALRRHAGRAGSRRATLRQPWRDDLDMVSPVDAADEAVAVCEVARLAAAASRDERVVMAGLWAGLDKWEVAGLLGRSPARVSQHLRALRRKVG